MIYDNIIKIFDLTACIGVAGYGLRAFSDTFDAFIEFKIIILIMPQKLDFTFDFL